MKLTSKLVSIILSMCIMVSVFGCIGASALGDEEYHATSLSTLQKALNDGITNILIDENVDVTEQITFPTGYDVKIVVAENSTIDFKVDTWVPINIQFEIKGFLKLSEDVRVVMDKAPELNDDLRGNIDKYNTGMAAFAILGNIKTVDNAFYAFGNKADALQTINSTLPENRWISTFVSFGDFELTKSLSIGNVVCLGNLTLAENVKLTIKEESVHIEEKLDNMHFIKKGSELILRVTGDVYFEDGASMDTGSASIEEITIYDFANEQACGDFAASQEADLGAPIYQGLNSGSEYESTLFDSYLCVYKSTYIDNIVYIDIVGDYPHLVAFWLDYMSEGLSFCNMEQEPMKELISQPFPCSLIFYMNAYDAERKVWNLVPVDPDELNFSSNFDVRTEFRDGEIDPNGTDNDYYVEITPKDWGYGTVTYYECTFRIKIEDLRLGFFSEPSISEESWLRTFDYSKTNRSFYCVYNPATTVSDYTVDIISGSDFVNVEEIDGKKVLKLTIKDDVALNSFDVIVEYSFTDEYSNRIFENCRIVIHHGDEEGLYVSFPNWFSMEPSVNYNDLNSQCSLQKGSHLVHFLHKYYDSDANEWKCDVLDLDQLTSSSENLVLSEGNENDHKLIKVDIKDWGDYTVSFGGLTINFTAHLLPFSFYKENAATEENYIDSFEYTDNNRSFYFIYNPSLQGGSEYKILSAEIWDGSEFAGIEACADNKSFKITIKDFVEWEEFGIHVELRLRDESGAEWNEQYWLSNIHRGEEECLLISWPIWEGESVTVSSENAEPVIYAQKGSIALGFFHKYFDDSDNVWKTELLRADQLTAYDESVTLSTHERNPYLVVVNMENWGDFKIGYDDLFIDLHVKMASASFYLNPEPTEENWIDEFEYTKTNRSFYWGLNLGVPVFDCTADVVAGSEFVDVEEIDGKKLLKLTVKDDIAPENFEVVVEYSFTDEYNDKFFEICRINISRGEEEGLYVSMPNWRGEIPDVNYFDVSSQFCSSKGVFNLYFLHKYWDSDTNEWKYETLDLEQLTSSSENLVLSSENEDYPDLITAEIKDWGDYTVSFGDYSVDISSQLQPFSFYKENAATEENYINSFEYTDDNRSFYFIYDPSLQNGPEFEILSAEIGDGSEFADIEASADNKSFKITIKDFVKWEEFRVHIELRLRDESGKEWNEQYWLENIHRGDGECLLFSWPVWEGENAIVTPENAEHVLYAQKGSVILGFFHKYYDDSDEEWKYEPLSADQLTASDESVKLAAFEGNPDLVVANMENWGDFTISYNNLSVDIYVEIPPVGFYLNREATEDNWTDEFEYTDILRTIYCMLLPEEKDKLKVMGIKINDGGEYVTVTTDSDALASGVFEFLIKEDAPREFELDVTVEVQHEDGHVSAYSAHIHMVDGNDTVKVLSMEISKMPEKTEYVTGEVLDTKGMELTVEFSNGVKIVTDKGFTCMPDSFDSEGDQTVTVTYGDSIATFNVKVFLSEKDKLKAAAEAAVKDAKELLEQNKEKYADADEYKSISEELAKIEELISKDATEEEIKAAVEALTEKINSFKKYVANSEAVKHGDVDGDGKVTMWDIVLIQRYIASLDELNDVQKQAADVDDNTKVNLLDVVAIQQFIAEIIEIL